MCHALARSDATKRVKIVAVSGFEASSSKQVTSIRARNALALIGVGVALIVNAAWVGFLGYCLVRLI
jgi:hypothetical protein